tara:strand:+ start:1923 stop:2519 length:597 start_codon:yes stop_codon:yes gene_type:complete
MSLELLLPLLGFAFVTSATPGPNNLMLMASGVNFGFRRSIPHMFGIGVGFVFLQLGVGFGLGALLTAFPALHLGLKIAGGLYMLYLAWRIAMTRSYSENANLIARPMRFMEAAAFQWVNPKAWVIAVTGMAVYTDPRAPIVSVLVIAAVYIFVNLPTISVWTGFGVVLRDFLSNPVRLKWFNVAMGVALVLTLWPMLR